MDASMKVVERWARFELELAADTGTENPYLDAPFEASFLHEETGTVTRTRGFCDGEGIFRLRFMPDLLGRYSYRTASRNPSLDGIDGCFDCAPASESNHGPVSVAKRSHFSYADGKPFFVMGSTAYAWTCRPAQVRAQTIASFSAYGFNKVRTLVFPKRYIGSFGDVDISYEPPEYPFPGVPGAFYFTRFNPAFFRAFDAYIDDLMAQGIEADVIFFHPYDADNHWGINSGMGHADQIRYLRYLMARLSAYRNVWWSLANEYDVVTDQQGRSVVSAKAKDWDALGEFVRANDPCGHPISIHTLRLDLPRPALDNPHLLSAPRHLHTPSGTEGQVRQTRRGRRVPVRGHYPRQLGQQRCRNHGGTLQGQSPARLAFMKSIFEDLPFFRRALPGKDIWYGPHDGTEARYSATIWDVWNCSELGRLEVGLRHRFEVGDWKAIRLVRLN